MEIRDEKMGVVDHFDGGLFGAAFIPGPLYCFGRSDYGGRHFRRMERQMTEDPEWYARYRREVEAAKRNRDDMREAIEWGLTEADRYAGARLHFTGWRNPLTKFGAAMVRKHAKEHLKYIRERRFAWGKK